MFAVAFGIIYIAAGLPSLLIMPQQVQPVRLNAHPYIGARYPAAAFSFTRYQPFSCTMRSLFGLPFALAVALMILPLSNSHAQDDSRSNSLEEGAWALLFQVNGLPNVTFFDGVVALKHHLSAKQAIRFGVGGNGGTSQDAAFVQFGVSAQGQYLIYPQPDREVNFYIGAGPKVGFNYNRREELEGPDTRRRAWELGLTGRLGVEWFATRSISFLGEYGNEFSIRLEKRNEPDFIDDDALDYLYRTSAKFGIAAYF